MKVTVFWAVVGTFVLLFIGEGLRIGRLLFVSRRQTKSIVKFERHNPEASKKILFVGDSTGHGSGTSHSDYSIVGRLGTDFPHAHIENSSRPGSHLTYACRILRAKVAEENYSPFDLVIIMIGGMDLVHCTPLWLVRRLLTAAIRYSKRCGRETVIVCPNNPGHAPMFRFPLSPLYRRRAKQFDSLYRRVAQEEGVRCVSLYREHNDPLAMKNLFSADKTHPNDEGYGLWYNEMKGVIRAILQ